MIISSYVPFRGFFHFRNSPILGKTCEGVITEDIHVICSGDFLSWIFSNSGDSHLGDSPILGFLCFKYSEILEIPLSSRDGVISSCYPMVCSGVSLI